MLSKNTNDKYSLDTHTPVWLTGSNPHSWGNIKHGIKTILRDWDELQCCDDKQLDEDERRRLAKDWQIFAKDILTSELQRSSGPQQETTGTEQPDRDAECEDRQAVCSFDECEESVGEDGKHCDRHRKMLLEKDEYMASRADDAMRREANDGE